MIHSEGTKEGLQVVETSLGQTQKPEHKTAVWRGKNWIGNTAGPK